jgi:APA family basic amino acid/polyamine antiporter
VFMKVNPRTQTQEFALLFFGGMILLSLVFLGTFENIVNYVMFLDSLNIAIVASTIFVLRRRASRNGRPHDGFRAPLFPVLPALFTLFLLGISINVLLTQTKQALMGAAISLTGLPVFWLMRKISNGRGQS